MQAPVQTYPADSIEQSPASQHNLPGKENSVKSEQKHLNRSMTSFIGSPILDRERSLRQSPTSKDEFWDALRSHYNYLMDDGLIATCREASSDLSYDDDENVASFDIWSFTEFIQQFNLLHDMLHRLQSTVSNSENLDEQNLNVMEERSKVGYFCKLFNEQAKKLSKKYPDMRDEINRRLNILNNKWEAVEQSINPHKPPPVNDGLFDEISNQMRRLRRWLRELEDKLCPIKPSANWTLENLEEKHKEQQILHKDIESKGKYVSNLLKHCDCLEGNIVFNQPPLRMLDAEHVCKVASNLEHRWHSIYLRSLEGQYLIEELIHKCKSGVNDVRLDRSFSDEPLKKYPRLSGDWDIPIPENEWCKMDFEVEQCDDVFLEGNSVERPDRWPLNKKREIGTSCVVKREIPLTNDKGIMVGSTGISQLKADCSGSTEQFEIIQDVGYSSETSAHFSNDEPHEYPGHNHPSPPLNQPTCTKDKSISPEANHCSPMYSTPNTKANVNSITNTLSPYKYPTFNLKDWQFRSSEDLLARLKPSNRSTVPDSFYKMTSIDSDAFDDAAETNLEKDFKIDEIVETTTAHCDQIVSKAVGKALDTAGSVISNRDISESTPKNVALPDISPFHSKNSLPNDFPESANMPVKLGKRSQNASSPKAAQKSLPLNEKTKRTTRVQEWLNKCQSGEDTATESCPENKEQAKVEWPRKLFVDSSCDASGEYTTTESDCDRSAASDDINNSLSFTQSFTGSVETVVPVSVGETSFANDDRAGSAEPSPNVCMRKKKRQCRERPWSAIEVHQMMSQPARFSHSTSEGAINILSCTPQDTKRTFSSYSSGDKYTRRSRSRSSLRSMGRHSETGSDGCLPFKKRLLFSGNKPSSLDSSQNSAATALEQLQSSLTSTSDCTNDVLHSSSSARQLSNKSNISESSKRSAKSHRKRNCKAGIQLVTKKDYGGIEEAEEKKPPNSTFARTSVSSTNYDNAVVNGEDQSSVSDQVWDEYQDPPYLSEPYSEQTADEDQLRKLINFGDDYRTILGSHSDASSIIAQLHFQRPPNSRSHRKSSGLSVVEKENPGEDPFDPCSDSDTEDFHNILCTSRDALDVVLGIYNKSQSDPAKQSSAFSSEFANSIATCQTHLCHLYAVQKELDVGYDLTSLTTDDFKKLQELIKEWEAIQAKLLNLPRKDSEAKVNSEHFEAAIIDVCDIMAALKEKLNQIGNNALKALDSFSGLRELDSKVLKLQNGLATLQEMKEAVLSVSARILRLSAEGGVANMSPLKDNATKLYQLWEDVYELCGSQLTKLQALQSRWKHPVEEDILKEGETAIQWQHVQVGDTKPKTVVSEELKLPTAGAEVLIPGHHDAIVEIDAPLPRASAKCCVTDCNQSSLEVPLLHNHPPALKCKTSGHKRCCEHSDVLDSSSENSTSPRTKKTRSRLWRTIRAAVPIQVALVMLYCMACLLEPHCCDNLNNFNFSMWPQLRYVRGPPPV